MPEVSVRTLGPYIIVGKRQTHLKKEMTYLRYVTTKYNFVNYWNWTFCVKNMFSKFTRIFFLSHEVGSTMLQFVLYVLLVHISIFSL